MCFLLPGLSGELQVDDYYVASFTIFPLEFTPKFVNTLLHTDKLWVKTNTELLATHKVPCLLKGELIIKDKPEDTFLYMMVGARLLSTSSCGL